MAKSKKSSFAENYERKHGIAWEYKGERLDRAKMDELKSVLEQYVYDDSADAIIFGKGKKPEPRYKIYIPKDDWKQIKTKYKDSYGSINLNKYIKIALSDLIDKYKIPPPFKRISEADARKAFVELAQDPELFGHLSRRHKELKHKKRLKKGKHYALELINHKKIAIKPSTNSIHDYKWKITDEKDFAYVITSSRVGSEASNFFHIIERMDVATKSGEAPNVVWNEPKLRKKMFDALWTMTTLKHLDMGNILDAMKKKVQLAGSFKPTVAKCLYRLFDAESVYDPSMGWGDRLLAFLATPHTKRYVGFDPNEKLHKGYKEQLELYGKALEPIYGIEKKVEMNASGAEVADFSKYENQFDLVFTSPPYFDTEKYSDDESQSYLLYPKLDLWLEKFLFKMLSGAWTVLKDGGVLAMNIHDIRKGSSFDRICDPMNDFISTLPGASFIGGMGMQISQMANTKADYSLVQTEPIWIWGKNNGEKKLLDYFRAKKKFLKDYDQPDLYD